MSKKYNTEENTTIETVEETPVVKEEKKAPKSYKVKISGCTKLNFRTSPEQATDNIGVVKDAGEVFMATEVEDNKDWLKVEDNGKTFYALKKFLKRA